MVDFVFKIEFGVKLNCVTCDIGKMREGARHIRIYEHEKFDDLLTSFQMFKMDEIMIINLKLTCFLVSF